MLCKKTLSTFVDTDECASSPCTNGATCNNLIDSYTCSCVAGFEGTNCETGMVVLNMRQKIVKFLNATVWLILKHVLMHHVYINMCINIYTKYLIM